MRVDFYHLTTSPLEQALPPIAERILAGGGRLLIVSDDDGQRARLDRLLWEAERESFIPHAQAGAGDDARQPVLIAAEVDAANRARHVALADGRWRDEALDFDRAFHFFDEDSIAAARTAWRGLRARSGIELHYWKRNEAGRWEDMAPVAKAESAD